MSGALAIGVDAGGTKVEALLVDVDRGGRILDRRLAQTPATDAEATTRTIVALARELMGERNDVAAVGVGAAGMGGRGGEWWGWADVAQQGWHPADEDMADDGGCTLVTLDV